MFTLLGTSKLYCALVLNVDMCTIYLKYTPEGIILSAASREVLKQVHRAPAITIEQRQARTIGFMPTISAGGQMVCGVWIIKDRDLKTSSWAPVGSFLNQHISPRSWTSRASCLFGWGPRPRLAART